MIVLINHREIPVFAGATIQDALLAYSRRSYKLVMNGYLVVKDRFGNRIELDGALREGQQIYLTKKKQP